MSGVWNWIKLPAVWLKYFVACSVAPGGGYFSAAQKASWSQPKIIQNFAVVHQGIPGWGKWMMKISPKFLPSNHHGSGPKWVEKKISNMIGSSFHLGPGVVFHWTWMREPNCFYVGEDCQKNLMWNYPHLGDMSNGRNCCHLWVVMKSESFYPRRWVPNMRRTGIFASATFMGR